MKKHESQFGSYFSSLFEPRAIIFGVALLHLIVTQVWVSRWWQGFGHQPGDALPDKVLNAPFLLVFAAGMWLLGRWWSCLLALAASGWLLYSVGVEFYAYTLVHDRPLHMWLTDKYVAQPQEFLELALASVIFCPAAFFLFRNWEHGGCDSGHGI